MILMSYWGLNLELSIYNKCEIYANVHTIPISPLRVNKIALVVLFTSTRSYTSILFLQKFKSQNIHVVSTEPGSHLHPMTNATAEPMETIFHYA